MMVALREFSGGVKLRRFMARADAGVGAVEMAMVVARGAVGREKKMALLFVVRRRCDVGLLLFPASFNGGRRGDGGGGCHGDGRRGEN